MIMIKINIAERQKQLKNSLQIETIDKKRHELYRDEMMATLGQMAGGMVHEFNTPLQAIKFIAQSTHRFLDKNKISPEDIKKNLERIVEVVDILAGQVDHIKALAKDDHLKTEELDVNTIIKNAFDLFEQQLKNRKIKVTFDLQSNLPKINANRYRLEQAFINLIQNSKDALEKVPRRKKEIIVRTQYVKGSSPYISIYFKDNGIGIKKTDKKKIFEPFFTSKENGKGIGIGLSIVKEIISQSGGSIKIHNKSSTGVAFVIEIPVKTREA
jgi:C4-dicarboxylate-specific signal transduction histidine kinase